MTKKTLFILLAIIGLTQFSFGQGAATKSKVVAQLFNQTSPMIPIEFIENVIRTEVETSIIKDEKAWLADLYTKIEADTTITNQKREELKVKLPEFSKNFHQLLRKMIFADLDMKKWYQQSFATNISKGFTLAELKKLTAYFSTQPGKDFVQKINQISSEGVVNKVPQNQNPKLKEAISTQDVLTKKFIDVLLKDVGKGVGMIMDKWQREAFSEKTKQKNDKEIVRLTLEFFEVK